MMEWLWLVQMLHGTVCMSMRKEGGVSSPNLPDGPPAKLRKRRPGKGRGRANQLTFYEDEVLAIQSLAWLLEFEALIGGLCMGSHLYPEPIP
jgi:hypothetical protein